MSPLRVVSAPGLMVRFTAWLWGCWQKQCAAVYWSFGSRLDSPYNTNMSAWPLWECMAGHTEGTSFLISNTGVWAVWLPVRFLNPVLYGIMKGIRMLFKLICISLSSLRFCDPSGTEVLPALWPANGSLGEEGGAHRKQPAAQSQGEQGAGVLRETVPRDPQAKRAAGADAEVGWFAPPQQTTDTLNFCNSLDHFDLLPYYCCSCKELLWICFIVRCRWLTDGSVWVDLNEGSSDFFLFLFAAVLANEGEGWPQLQLAVSMKSLKSLMEYQSMR